MIARIWHGTTEAAKSDEYVEYLKETGIPDYRRTKGNRGAYILRKIENDTAHFYTLSFWDSFDSIKEFAGEDYELARYYAEDDRFLLEFEPTVRHFEVFGERTGESFVMRKISGVGTPSNEDLKAKKEK